MITEVGNQQISEEKNFEKKSQSNDPVFYCPLWLIRNSHILGMLEEKYDHIK